MSKGKTTSDKNRQDLQSLCDEMFAGWQHFDSEEAECRFVKRIFGSHRRHRMVRLYAWAAVAASLLVIIGMALGQHNETVRPTSKAVTYETRMKAPAGHDLIITLSDNSRIRLHSGSTLSYAHGFGYSHRNLTLEGKAIFNVHHRTDLPMHIHTPHLIVIDLGTVFSVNDKMSSHKASVTLYSGKALVQGNRPLARSYTLKPHESIAIDTEGKLICWTRPVPNNRPKSVDNDLFFVNTSLEDIANRLSKIYGVDIDVAPSIRGQRFDGFFNSKDDKLEDIIDALSQSEGLRFIKEGKKYLIE